VGDAVLLDGRQHAVRARRVQGPRQLILPGPPGTYADPGGLLEGDGKTGKHLKIRTLAELPGTAVRGWLKTAAARAES